MSDIVRHGLFHPRALDPKVLFDRLKTTHQGKRNAAIGCLAAAFEGRNEGNRGMKLILRTSQRGRALRHGCIAALSMIVLPVAHTLAGPVSATYSVGAEVPITASQFNAVGKTLNVALNFVPKPGTKLTVIRNTGPGMIHGTFANAAQGQTISISYAGLIFQFVANYHGGEGNDLVLEWTTDGNLSSAALTKLDPQLILALKQVRGIAPFDKPTSLRPNIPARDGERVLVNVDGSISKDLTDAISLAGGQVVNGFVTGTSARAMVPVSQLESLAARNDVSAISATKLSVTSKLAP